MLSTSQYEELVMYFHQIITLTVESTPSPPQNPEAKFRGVFCATAFSFTHIQKPQVCVCVERGEGRGEIIVLDQIVFKRQDGGPEGQLIEIDIGNQSIQLRTIEIHRRLLSIDIDNR